MNTNINFTHFRFAQPCFKNRQEMLDFLEQIPKYDRNNPLLPNLMEIEITVAIMQNIFGFLEQIPEYDRNNPRLLNLMEIEVTEAIWKTANEFGKRKDETKKIYEKLKELQKSITFAKASYRMRDDRLGTTRWRTHDSWFYGTREWFDYNFFLVSFERYNHKMKHF